MNDLDIYRRSSQLLLLNNRMAYHFLFVDCCFPLCYICQVETTAQKWSISHWDASIILILINRLNWLSNRMLMPQFLADVVQSM